MGFIKEDIVQLTSNSMEEMKYRILKYSHFVSRVIYDMKWYETTNTDNQKSYVSDEPE